MHHIINILFSDTKQSDPEVNVEYFLVHHNLNKIFSQISASVAFVDCEFDCCVSLVKNTPP